MSSDPVSRAGAENAWLRTYLAGKPGSAASSGQALDHTLIAADTDREQAVDALQSAYAEGRLSKGEFDSRVSAVLTARTHGALRTATAGLPRWPAGPALVPWPGQRPEAGTARTAPARAGTDGASRRSLPARSLLLWVSAEFVCTVGGALLSHSWPSNVAVFAASFSAWLIVSAGLLRFCWRLMSGR
jgi:hypothetical protein